jgi:hypothetical protein
MCRCTPEIRTPFCGKPGCTWPEQRVPNGVVNAKQAGDTVSVVASMLMSVPMESFEALLRDMGAVQKVVNSLGANDLRRDERSETYRLGLETARRVTELRRWMEQATKNLIAPIGDH